MSGDAVKRNPAAKAKEEGMTGKSGRKDIAKDQPPLHPDLDLHFPVKIVRIFINPIYFVLSLHFYRECKFE
jgi:hypothetical protein